jgi:hypothetical protein
MKKLTILLGLTAILFSQTALAQVDPDELKALREQVRILTQRLDELEKANQQTSQNIAQANAATTAQVDEVVEEKVDKAVTEQVDERMAAVSWAERIRLKGDFRYRYETIKVEDVDNRNRNRIRARFHLEADVTDTVQVGFGLATGGEDPVSSNQTLGGGGSSKDIRLDLAYFDWSGLSNTHILGGKVKNFLVKPAGHGLMWDSDWRPEGFGVIWDNDLFFAQGIGTWIESDSKKGENFAWIAQGGMNFRLGETTRFKVGAGYAQFNVAGDGSFFGDDDDFFGNSFDPITNTYLYDYHEVEVFAGMTTDLADRPLLVYADYVVNTAVDDNDTGYAIGIKYGKASARGTWAIGYTYKKLEADAVIGLLTDSDFGGGGTDAKGSIFKGAWAIRKNWNAQITYFLNDIDLASGNPRDFNRLMLDLKFKYK